MSGWYWRVIVLKAAFLLTYFVSSLRADDTVQKLPFCNPATTKDTPNFNDLVIVSTLDGKITAFSTENGIKAWDLETQPLLSSNLHNIELTSNGKWVRIVPSLRGTLYSLSGDSIEPLPFSAEQLLSSSFKYSDDMVIAGARESLWLGVEAQTGNVIYECGSSGCNSEQQTAGVGRDMIVLRRYSVTVRALDPRSGSEKWNFSVAEHQLTLSRRECANKNKPRVVAVAVALPEGQVVVNDPETKTIIWQRKLESPVVNMWRLQGGSLEYFDVLLEAAHGLIEVNAPTYPSLYLGVHNTQLYIQETKLYAQKVETAVANKPIPWKLKKSRPLLTDGSTALAADDDTSLSVVIPWNIGKTEISENHGFFLYFQDKCEEAPQMEASLPDIVLPNNSDDTNHHHVHVHVYSLWFWWKEVLVIAVSSALLLNLLIWPRFFPPKVITSIQKKREFVVVRRPHFEQKPTIDYLGRYDSDFTTVKYLGKGGFGVVFEARNKIDDCSYAVKRITLPRRESQRERVLREVRALAKLDHEHIVRYFNAWVEEPPQQWQELRDQQLMQELEGVSLAMSDEYTSPTSPPLPNVFSKPSKGDVKLNLHKSIDDFEYEKHLSEPRKPRSQSCNDSFTVEFDYGASKPRLTSESSRSDVTANTLSKSVGGGDSDVPSIVFVNSNMEHSGLPNKVLDNLKESESYKTKASHSKKKKGHTRHWSLDMVVNNEQSKMYLYIQMQLCKRDSLHDWLKNNTTWDARRDLVKPLFSQIVSAVEYVHRAGLIHRDLKPRNIFFSLDGKVKVGDFGLVTTMTDNIDGPTELNAAHALHTHKVGTHLYMSPEQLQGRSYSYKVDIYSLGLVLFEMLHPFGTDSERITCLMNARRGKYPYEFVRDYPDETEVLKLMLSEDPHQRPTAKGVRAKLRYFTAQMNTYSISYSIASTNHSQCDEGLTCLSE